jgi:putative radical SAM enzyme (TIGR03279 family)
MLAECGLQIDTVQPGSLADKAGLRPGDTLLSVNAHRLKDPIDFIYHSTDEDLHIDFKRGSRMANLCIKKIEGAVLGIVFKPFRIMTCKNNCIFCFVKQLPQGLRKTLYVKDEDYRMSFLYGNYITLSNLSREDKKRIVEQRLTPLFISVHSTNRAVRNRLLGNPKAPDIMKELQFLSDHKIRFNVQIVLCPGLNDGRELRQTLSDLYRFYPYLLSVAVVPVGLTMHRKQNLNPVEKEDALKALNMIESFQKRYVKRHGNPIIYGADELYLKAEKPFPPLREYGELHQIENGVGMVPLFLSQAKKLRIPETLQRRKKYLTFTGTAFYPFLEKFAERLSERERIRIDLLQVENRFFGTSITVAGLLTGRDVIKAALDRTDGHEMLLVPDVVLDGEDRFLDNITLRDIEGALGIPVRKIASTPNGIMKGLSQAA